jgi:Flp pilus assembly protein protease CpaA
MVIGIASFVLAIGLGVFSWWRVPTWSAREFGQRNFKWKIIVLSSFAFSLLSSLGLYFFVTHNLWVSLSVGLVGYVTILASVTDFGILKIPHEITTLGSCIPIPFVAIFWPSLDQLSMIIWFVLVFVFAILSLFGFMGWADVKLLVIFGFAFSWWVGIQYMTYGLIVAVLIQIVLIPLAGPLKLGVKKKIGAKTAWNEETKRMEPIIEEPNEDDFIGDSPKRSTQKRELQDSKKKERTHLPFGPALMIAYMGIAIYASFDYAGSIFSWWGI